MAAESARQELAGRRDEVYRCMRCGFCMAVCPIYRELGEEPAVARGKIGLMAAHLDGELAMTRGFEKALKLCLSCKACTSACPSGVAPDELVMAARADCAAMRGMPLAKRLVLGRILPNPGLLSLCSKLALVAGPLLFEREPGSGRMCPRFSLGIDKRRTLPPFPARGFREMLRAEIRSGKRRGRQTWSLLEVKAPVSRMRVAFFTGCSIDRLFPSIGRAVIDVLQRNGVDVVVPLAQRCCGTPALVHGDWRTARRLASENLQVFGSLEVDAVVNACASCGCTLRHGYRQLFRESGPLQEFEGWSSKVYDISEFLMDVAGFYPGPVRVKTAFTYHDPCHLARGQRITKAPRELLQLVAGLNLIEMQESDSCCGGAGSFFLEQPELSMRILGRKIKNIERTGAGVVASGCPACLLQLGDGLARDAERKGIRALHPIEILAGTYAR
ncbi:MAG: (Fe-S)-binding protein [Firmicutes bacterium]|nr:(Fe-S)-binding protein [Bacillota bacterium]